MILNLLLKSHKFENMRLQKPKRRHWESEPVKKEWVSPDKKFYNSKAWRRTREDVLNKNPMCVVCEADGKLTEANHVDHIIPIRDGGHRWKHSNLQSLCIRCHSIKTRKENRHKNKM